MKYVRTDDGIFVKERDTALGKTTLLCYLDEKGKITDIEKGGREAYKEADTIEELCDAYVLDEQLFYRIEDLKLYIKQLKELNHWTVDMIKPYGAIWTDKGLIYVARMNEEGKFELLC